MRAIATGLPVASGRPPPSSGFCHPMRLSDFIDFISVEREREDRRELFTTTTIPLSQLEATNGGAIVYCSVCQRRRSNRINLRIRESAN